MGIILSIIGNIFEHYILISIKLSIIGQGLNHGQNNTGEVNT